MPVLGRIGVAALFLPSGIIKLMDPAATMAQIKAASMPLPIVAYGIAICIEIAGSVLLVLGYRTRLVAMVFVLYSLATALSFHTNFANQQQFYSFWKNIAIAGGFLQIIAFGAGGLSLDARRSASAITSDA